MVSFDMHMSKETYMFKLCLSHSYSRLIVQNDILMSLFMVSFDICIMVSMDIKQQLLNDDFCHKTTYMSLFLVSFVICISYSTNMRERDTHFGMRERDTHFVPCCTAVDLKGRGG